MKTWGRNKHYSMPIYLWGKILRFFILPLPLGGAILLLSYAPLLIMSSFFRKTVKLSRLVLDLRIKGLWRGP